jgi:hypothetical protein
MNDNHATKQDIQELKTQIEPAVDALTELVRQVETNLLTSFHSYAKGQGARVHAMEIGGSAVAERLAALEDRVLNLETRRH